MDNEQCQTRVQEKKKKKKQKTQRKKRNIQTPPMFMKQNLVIYININENVIVTISKIIIIINCLSGGPRLRQYIYIYRYVCVRARVCGDENVMRKQKL